MSMSGDHSDQRANRTERTKSPTASKVRCLVGTYGDGGLWYLEWDQATDRWSAGPWMPDLHNISYGDRHPTSGLHYLIEEANCGQVHIFDPQASKVLATHPSGGRMPCHLSLSPDGRRLAIAHYGSGSVSLLGLDETGLALDGKPSVHFHLGSGADPNRQASPHVHCAHFSPDGQFLYAVDLGTDEVLAYPIRADGLIRPFRAFRVRPGEGPRHILFHPVQPIAFLLTEMGSCLYALQVHPDGQLTELDRVSTVPRIHAPQTLGGHLDFDPDRALIYVSNRGQDSIAQFRIEQDNSLTFVAHVPSMGASPRHFVRLPTHQRVVVAHEQSQSTAVLSLSPSGKMEMSNLSLHVPGVAFIAQV